jgi:hypothetical protein
MCWAGHVEHIGEMSSEYRISQEPQTKRLLGRPRYRWENIINIRNMGYDCVNRIELAQVRVQWQGL